MMKRRILLSLIVLSTSLLSFSGSIRSWTEKARFAKIHPCPATGQKIPHCPGYVIDHIIPLCKGGPDKAENMQWQTIADGKAKDKVECKK